MQKKNKGKTKEKQKFEQGKKSNSYEKRAKQNKQNKQILTKENMPELERK